MDRLQKFLAKLDAKRRKKLEKIIEAICTGHHRGLNIKPLTDIPGHYRCRVGDIRILFRKYEGGFIAYDAGFRGDIY